MIRTIAAIAVTLLLALPAAAAEAPPAPVQLNTEIRVESDVILLGDLFAGLSPAAAATPVAYAPELGRRAVVDAAWLAKIARRHRVAWKPASRFERATVERASEIVQTETIEDAIRGAVMEAEPGRAMEVRFDTRGTQMHVPAGAALDVAVRNFRYDDRSGRFSALVVAPADDPVAEMRVLGKSYEVAEIPVLTNRMTRGEVIGEDDIEWTQVHAGRLNGTVILDAARLIGMTPRRLLRPGVPVRASDVEEPVIVSKGSLVTIAVRTDLMTLTARGRAIEDGAQGKAIRVMNVQSKKVVEAVVVDAGTVVVGGGDAASID